MLEEQLEDLGVAKAEEIFAVIGSDRDALVGVIGYLSAHLGDKLTEDKNLVEGVDFLFGLDQAISSLADAGETAILQEFNGRRDDLIESIMNLED